MYNKTEINAENLLSADGASHYETESFFKDITTRTNGDAALVNNNSDATIKTESPFLDFYLQKDGKCFTEHLVKQIKSETVIDRKTDIEEHSVISDLVSVMKRECFTKQLVVKIQKCDVEKKPWRLDAKNSSFSDNIKKEGKCFTKHLVKQIKSETHTCSNNCKTHRKSEIEEHAVVSDLDSMMKRECFAKQLVIKIKKCDVKEKPQWFNIKTSSVSDVIKETVSDVNGINEDLVSTQSPRLTSKGVSQEDSGTCTSISDSGEHSQIGEVASNIKTANVSTDFPINVERKSEVGQNICQSNFSTSHACDSHSKNFGSVRDKQNLHDKRRYKCASCGKSFTSKFILIQHRLTHSNARNFKCNSCDKCFKRKGDLKDHLTLHLGIEYKCDICEKSYKSRSSLNRHIPEHSDTKPYKCDRCEKYFKSRYQLKAHMEYHSEIKPYKCDKCEKSFHYKNGLSNHILVHSDIKSYKCDRCEKSFKWKWNLENHANLHSDIKAYKCDKCEMSFKYKHGLRVHFSVHSDIKLFKCDKCGQSFKLKQSLKLHLFSVHSNIKLFKCDRCEKYFKSKRGLEMHFPSHSDIRPYKCDRCNKYFKWISNLRAHSSTFKHKTIQI